MNISSTRLYQPAKLHSPTSSANSEPQTFGSTSGGAKDFFQSAARSVGDNPVRSIVTVANLATAVGTLSTYGSNTQNAQFTQGASYVMGAVQAIGGLGRGIDALSSMGYSSTQLGVAPKTQVVSALGDLMSAAGQFALASGVSAPAAVLLLGGNVVSGIADFKS
jgi:hypothetical protein